MIGTKRVARCGNGGRASAKISTAGRSRCGRTLPVAVGEKRESMVRLFGCLYRMSLEGMKKNNGLVEVAHPRLQGGSIVHARIKLKK